MKIERALAPLAAALFACVADSSEPVAEKTQQALENGSFRADLNGFGIHYEVHGKGPVLMILSNSWGINVPALRALLKDLETDLKLVYFDPRGMGGSDPIQVESDMGMAAVREDFDALRRHLGLEKVNALGWSNGAINLVKLASEKPDTIAAAIFLHGAASFTEEDNVRWAESYPELAESYTGFFEKMQDPSKSDDKKTSEFRRLWVEEMFPHICADPESCKPMVAEVFKNCPFSWPHADYSNRESSTFDYRRDLPSITCPTLIIHGKADMIPLEKAEELARGIPRSRLLILEKSGHFGPKEEPEIFRQTALEFLMPN